MFARSKNTREAVIDIKFNDTLSWSSCSKMVVEIIKYLAYQKQQIPYPFEQLKLLLSTRKPTGASGEGKPEKLPVRFGIYYQKAAEAVRTLDSIFENIEVEFMMSAHEDIGDVEEVVVLFGATPVTPKDVFRIQLPVIRGSYDFETPKPPPRRMMVHLLRCLLESESLHTMVSQPVSATNTFIFFKRRPICDDTTVEKTIGVSKSWFLPRENFKLPQTGRQAILRIQQTFQETSTSIVESPLARPLVEISDVECTVVNDLCSNEKTVGGSSKVGKNLEEQCSGDNMGQSATMKLSNHLVFKVPSLVEKKYTPSKTAMANDYTNSHNTEQCLIGGTSSSITGLSSALGKLTFHIDDENMSSFKVKTIEWFEARAPIRGFKDHVVNGISAISS